MNKVNDTLRVQIETEKAAHEVWEVVQAHNKAWSELKDIHEQLKYVHPAIVFVKPPYQKLIQGIENYQADYENWLQHARVDFFREVNPIINIYGNGNFAIVSYLIEMAFTYEEQVVADWNGADMMTLVRENGKWLITSDMYARKTHK